MNDRAALLGNPADDTARLVLADWLEEHGEELFGRFVRAGVVASRFPSGGLIDDPTYYATLAVIASVAASGEPARWVAALGLGPTPLTQSDWGWDNTGDRVTVRVGASRGVFVRGVLTELELTLGEWYAVASAALAVWPVELVRVSDVPGLTFTVGPILTGWGLTGRVKAPQRPARRSHPPVGRRAAPSADGPGCGLGGRHPEAGRNLFDYLENGLWDGGRPNRRQGASFLATAELLLEGGHWPLKTHRHRGASAAPRDSGAASFLLALGDPYQPGTRTQSLPTPATPPPSS